MKFNSKKIDISKYIVYIIFVLCLIIFGIWLKGSFFSLSNLLNITRQAGAVSVMAIGMVFVIGLGHIDLSIGSVVAVSSLITAYILRDTGNPVLAVIVAIGFGAIVGLFNGLCVTTIGMPAFLTTLGSQAILTGIAMWISATKAVPITHKGFLFWFGSGTIGQVPILLLWAVGATVIGYIVLNNTSYGRKILATGGNATSAKYSGVRVNKITVLAFIYNGCLAAIAGTLYAGRAHSARWDFGSGVEMNVIAAVVLGGTRMIGGIGTLRGCLLGTLLLTMVSNSLILLGISVYWEKVFIGAIIIIGTAVSAMQAMRASRTSAKKKGAA